MDLEGKKELLEQKSSLELGNKSSTSTNTFILNMSREEIFDRVLGKEKEDAKPKKAVTDIIVEEIIDTED